MSVVLAKYAPTLVPKASINQANGVAGLDANSKILAAQLPAGIAAFTRKKERFALVAADITSGYKDLSQTALSNSMTAGLQGLGLLEESQDGGTTGDYTLSVVGGKTRFTWINDLVDTVKGSALAAGAELYFHYSY